MRVSAAAVAPAFAIVLAVLVIAPAEWSMVDAYESRGGENYARATRYTAVRGRAWMKEQAENVRSMFFHAYDGYMRSAFPSDELKPLSCTGSDEFFGQVSLTLVDSLDSLAVFGNRSEFQRAVDLVLEFLTFDIDSSVSVFETNIRILEGFFRRTCWQAIQNSLSFRGNVLWKVAGSCGGP